MVSNFVGTETVTFAYLSNSISLSMKHTKTMMECELTRLEVTSAEMAVGVWVSFGFGVDISNADIITCQYMPSPGTSICYDMNTSGSHLVVPDMDAS